MSKYREDASGRQEDRSPSSSQHQVNEQGSERNGRSASQYGKQRPLRVMILAVITFIIASLMLTMCLLLVTGREPVPAAMLAPVFSLIGVYYLAAIALWRSYSWAPGITLVLYVVTIVLYVTFLRGVLMQAFSILAVPAGIYALSTWLFVRRLRRRPE